MRVLRRGRLLAALLVTVAIAAVGAGCGSSNNSSSTKNNSSSTSTPAASTSASGTASSSSALKDPGKHTITVIPSTAASAFLANAIGQFKQTAAPLGWTVNVCDPGGVVTKMESCLEDAVTQKVSAVVTMALGGPEIQNGYAQAKAAGIPVIEYLLTPQPGFGKYFDAVFADDLVKLGAATAKWVATNRKGIPITGLDISQNYGGHGYIVGFEQQLAREGLKFTDLRDTDLANLVSSIGSTALAIVNAHKGPLTLIDPTDFGNGVIEPELQRIGRAKDVAIISRYDDPATLKLMRAGDNIYVQVTRSYDHMFDMFSALLAYFTDKTPLPPTSKTVYEPDARIMGIKDFPAGATEAFPFAPALKAQLAKWAKTYKLQG